MYNIDANRADLQRRAEALMTGSLNRYQMTVKIARRAKQFRFEDFNNPDASVVKPIVRAIVEMSDELAQPELLHEELP
ncbi:MAG: DNA-directed RNA polymerase subunit omega [Oscillatoriales cyanobacterium RM2_1_1]|nr:DNA-directed RNA polymerase subunit omega [Oscillatoriales cyanobacterium SM2_3_0]NJO46748.1 DNA-directed RNA polymerase subunit omega [Oscillatoriales cyanobacterium RM2_1_1]